ncbi:hypothetical protein Tco_1429992 [Tanacetum coccineum]
MPLSAYLNLGLGELAHTRLTVELADKTMKYPKGIAKNMLVGIGKFVFPIEFYNSCAYANGYQSALDLGKSILSTAHAKIDVFKRKITLRMSQESDDDMEYDPSDVEFTAWLASKNFNYKTMDHYTKRALWIFWLRGDDEVKLTDEGSSDSDDEDEVAKIFRIETNVFDFETPLCRAFKEFNYLLHIGPNVLTKDIEGFKTYEEYKDDWIYEWNENVPWVHEKPLTDTRVWTEPALVVHCCKLFNYKNRYSEWSTCSWKEDGYFNRGNLPRAYIIGNTLHYQDLEWYEALKDSELKEEALRNKAIMEGLINDDDESSNNGWRRWDGYEIADHDQEEREYENEHEDEERCELFDDHELPVCTIRRFKMIKYSFRQDEEYVAIKEDEYEGLNNTSKGAIQAYQEIFSIMDEGWMVTRAE